MKLKFLDGTGSDIILVSGNTYIDSPFIGIAVIGNLLTSKGFKVASIAQTRYYNQ
jgi:hypothetical protein